MNNLKRFLKRLVDNAYSFSVIAKVISVVSGLVYSILYSRYLGAALRGEASIINNYSDMIMLFLCLGVYQAYPYFKKTTGEDRYQQYIDQSFGMVLVYAAIAAVPIIAFDIPLQTKVIIGLVPLLVGIKLLNYVVLIENPKVRNTAQIWLDLFDIAFLCVLFIFTKANLELTILFLVAKQAVAFIIAVANLHVPVFKIRPTLKGILPSIKYGLIPMVTVIMMELNYKVDVVMLERLNISKADIGIYSLGVMLAQKLWMIPDALKDILLSKLAGGKSKDEVCVVSRMNVAIVTLCVIAMVILGKPIIWLLFGKEYEAAYPVLLVIVLGVIGMVFYKTIYSYNVVNGHKNLNFVLLAIAAVINIILNWITIPKIGIMGAAFASMVSYLICGISYLVCFSRMTDTPVMELVLIKREDVERVKRFVKK